MEHIERMKLLVGHDVDADTKIEELGFDSLELLEFFHELNVPRTAIEDFFTLGNVADYLTSRNL